MAFFAYDATRQAVQTIGPNDRLRADSVGAYFAYDATHEAVQPINGIALGGSAVITDEVMRQTFGSRRPIAVVGNWAVRVTDAVWKPVTNQRNELTLIPIGDHDLKSVKASAGGHDVPMIGVYAPRSTHLQQSENAFVGTPYTYVTELAVFSLADSRPIPVPSFLTLARIRDADDPDGGSGPVLAAAQALGGVLVYVISIEGLPQRPLPPIQAALARLPRLPKVSAPGAPPPPATPAVIPAPGAPPPAPASGYGSFSRKGMLGTISTPTIALGVGIFALCGAVVAVAAMGGSK